MISIVRVPKRCETRFARQSSERERTRESASTKRGSVCEIDLGRSRVSKDTSSGSSRCVVHVDRERSPMSVRRRPSDPVAAYWTRTHEEELTGPCSLHCRRVSQKVAD